MIKTIRLLWPMLLEHRRTLILGIIALILKDLLAVGAPLLIKAGVDTLATSLVMSTVLWYGAALIGLSIAKGFFQYWMRVLMIGVSRDIEYDLRKRLFDHMVTLDRGFFERFRTGDIMARSTSDLNAVRVMLGPAIMYWTETVIMFLLATGIMLWYDWKLTLIALSPAPLVSFAVIIFGRRIHARAEEIQKIFGAITSRVQENLAGVRVVRAYAQEQHEVAEFEKLNQTYIGENLKLALTSGSFMPMLEALIALSFLVVLWAGGARLLDHQLTLGSFLMFNVLMGMLAWPMIALGWVVNQMQRGAASIDRLMQLFDEKPSITAPAIPKRLAEPPQGGIEFEDVSLSYGPKLALSKIRIRVEPGSTIAVAGHTGSGKTTLVQLIPRLLDVSLGAVRIDGIDVRELDPAQLRRHIGFVPQETFLFSTTIAENIAFGVETATREKIEWAADIAGLTPDIAGFPEGLDTKVGERGITLSGGQRQRTAIARAILREPKILILDDALSSVDTVTEERILTGLAGVMKGRTTILISHRVSTLRSASQIYVIENGMLAEQGTHSELLSAGGYYADLHQKQLLEEELEAI